MTSGSSPTTEETSGSGSSVGGGNTFSQRSTLHAPWAQVVRGGGESDPIAPRSSSASPSAVLMEHNPVSSDQLTVTEPQAVAAVETHTEASEGSNNDNASGVKKSPWNKPSANGVVEGSSTPVMGAVSWPALSELTRALPKSSSFSSDSSSKPTSDGSIPISQAPEISQQPQKPVRTNASNQSSQNHAHPVRQRSMKRGGGAGGGYTRPPPPPPPPQPPTPPPPPPQFPIFPMPYRSFVPAMLDTPVRDQSPYNGNTFAPRPMSGVGSHSHGSHDHSSNRRRNNFGPRPRGDGGLYLNNGHGGRRDHHDREWRGPQNHGPRTPPMAPPPPPRGFMQQAHLGPASFIAPQSLRPYAPPMGYATYSVSNPSSDITSYWTQQEAYQTAPENDNINRLDMAAPFVYVPLPTEAYRGVPRTPPPPPPMFIPVMETHTPLSVLILQQIEYYFSDPNLVKDEYLKSNMDEEGWVPLSLIAGFRRVQNLTSDIQMILSSLRDSTVVEVQGETIRRRNDWKKWVKPSDNIPTDSNNQILETSLQNIALTVSPAGSGQITESPSLANGEVNIIDESASADLN